MKIYVVTGMHVDFESEDEDCEAFEPAIFGDRQTAETAIDELCGDGCGEWIEEPVGHDGFSRDIRFSNLSGNVTIVKARLL